MKRKLPPRLGEDEEIIIFYDEYQFLRFVLAYDERKIKIKLSADCNL